METKKITFLTSDQESIISLCTPQGSGAVALLRISGEDSIEIADKIARLSSGKKLNDVSSHSINHGHVVYFSSSQEIIDEVLFFLMKAPKTYTGQNTVEISCHNNCFIIEQIINQAIYAGARIARRGEFTKRAFLNNKIDLIQAESINELINSQTELTLKKSMSQLSGSLSYFLNELENNLIELLGIIEGSFEFFEEEQEDLDIDKLIKQKIDTILNKLVKIKVSFNCQQQIRQGIKIPIIGWVNVGKSTLFNSLIKKDRAIVTKIEGTTRDSIEYSLYKDGNFWTVIDTAGLRQTDDFIEKEGIERSWKQVLQADIILLIFDLSKILSSNQMKIYKKIIEKYEGKIIFIANKMDLEDKNSLNQLALVAGNSKIIKICAKKEIGMELIESEIENKIKQLFSKLQSPFLLNQRQYNLITQLDEKFKFIADNYLNKIQYELGAYHLRDLLEIISELTGKNVTEKMLDKVFSEFCVGK